jgi:putative ABC transport system permease protein
MVAVHTSTDPATMTTLIRSEIRSIESEMPMSTFTIGQLIDLSVAQRRFSTLLLGIFAGVAMVLSVVGIYGVMSYAVSQRTHEIGLRMALGAEARQVLRMIVREGLSVTCAGLAIGLAGAITVTRAMKVLLFGITNTDLFTYVSVSAILVLVALLACYFPARRAAGTDPLTALHHE